MSARSPRQRSMSRAARWLRSVLKSTCGPDSCWGPQRLATRLLVRLRKMCQRIVRLRASALGGSVPRHRVMTTLVHENASLILRRQHQTSQGQALPLESNMHYHVEPCTGSGILASNSNPGAMLTIAVQFETNRLCVASMELLLAESCCTAPE